MNYGPNLQIALIIEGYLVLSYKREVKYGIFLSRYHSLIHNYTRKMKAILMYFIKRVNSLPSFLLFFLYSLDSFNPNGITTTIKSSV